MRRLFSKIGLIFILLSMLAHTATAKASKNRFEFEDVKLGAEHIAIFVNKDGTFSTAVADVNTKTGGRLETALEDADYKGKFGNKLIIA